MRVTMDRAGRLVIPKEIREKAGWTAGTPLNIQLVDGVIEIEADYPPVRLEERGPFLVAVAAEGAPQLPADVVDRMREQFENERFGLK